MQSVAMEASCSRMVASARPFRQRLACKSYSTDDDGASTSSSLLRSSGVGTRTMERPSAPHCVNLVLTPKPSPALPQPVPVLHSSAYLQQVEQQGPAQTAEAPAASTSLQAQDGRQEEPFQGSALEWALRRVDRSLDSIEENPLPLQQQLYDVSRGPVGEATGRGLKVAAQFTMKAGLEAAKAVAPVGKWALSEGTKAAAGLVQYALLEAAKAKERQREKAEGGSGADGKGKKGSKKGKGWV